MPYPDTAEGFMVTDRKNWSNFTRQEFKLKPFEDRDIDVAVDACGVCASDVHTISGGWSPDFPVPLCVGHEIIGRVVKTGKDVTTVKVGDRVGVGAQIGADLTCNNCKANQETYCDNVVDTYGANWPDGTMSQGGFSSHVRAHEYFTFKIPDNIDSTLAAPMLCAGITVYSPLVRLGAGPGKTVGIIGIGGLGHFALLWASAMGADVVAISHSANKKEDALKFGAKDFVCTAEKGWAKPWKNKFDFVINASNATHQFDLSEYFSVLKVNGVFHMVGFPNEPLPAMNAMIFAPNGCSMGASHLGNRAEMEAMLKLASEKNIKPWVEAIDMSEEGCKTAVERVFKNTDVRYRLALVKFDKIFGQRA